MRKRRRIQVPTMVETNPALVQAVVERINSGNTLVILSQADNYRSYVIYEYRPTSDWHYLGDDDKRIHFRTDADWASVRFVEAFRPHKLEFFPAGYPDKAKCCWLLLFWGIPDCEVKRLHAAVEERLATK